jgi:UDP-N-acetyl-D-galactosamine dehydrogenase
MTNLSEATKYDCVIAAVPHAEFADFNLENHLKPHGLLADIKGMWRNKEIDKNFRRWSL